jgi:GTP-binding protein HflX
MVGLQGQNSIAISAKYGDNMDKLIEMIKAKLYSDRVWTGLLIPYDRGDITSDLRDRYRIDHAEYQSEGTYLEAELSREDFNRLESFRTSNGRA